MENTTYQKLKEMLCEELGDIVSGERISLGALDVIDKLTHSIKSLDAIIAMEEGSYPQYSTGTHTTSTSVGCQRMLEEVEALIGKATNNIEREALRGAVERLKRA